MRLTIVARVIELKWKYCFVHEEKRRFEFQKGITEAAGGFCVAL